ncbi:hypothetical protein PG999_012701 [Apiospora kogelbergensis]|uniref:Uncharacterized protein n=1 Tax=Apiospora kogelbergensis TaxID=1337665 RepID=A0AAW0QFI0_9PEZI
MGLRMMTVVVVAVTNVTVFAPFCVTVLMPPYSNDVVNGLGDIVAEADKWLVGNTGRQDASEQVTVVAVQISMSTNTVLELSAPSSGSQTLISVAKPP